MRMFKDKTGRDWPIEIDLAVITRVRTDTGVKLVDLVLGDAGKALADDYEAIGKLLWSVNAPHARAQSIEPETFAKLFDGSAIDAAMNALGLAVADFLSSGRRELAMKVIRKGDEVRAAAMTAANAKIDSIDPATLISILSAGATSSAALPASTPGT